MGQPSTYKGTICAFWQSLFCPEMDCGGWSANDHDGNDASDEESGMREYSFGNEAVGDRCDGFAQYPSHHAPIVQPAHHYLLIYSALAMQRRRGGRGQYRAFLALSRLEF